MTTPLTPTAPAAGTAEPDVGTATAPDPHEPATATRRTDAALDVYRDIPLDDGDAVLLLPDEQVCLELGPLSSADDVPAVVATLAQTVCGSTALLAVARRARRARPDDLLLWTELCVALDRSGTALLPLQVLPAAA